MLNIICKNCGKTIKAYTGLRGVNPVEIKSVGSEDFTIDDVYCKKCYSGNKTEPVKLKTHSLFPVIEKYRFYDRFPEMNTVIRKIGSDKAQSRYGETSIIRCTDSEVVHFIDGLRETHNEVSELVINKVQSEKGATSLEFFMQDITLRATRLKDGRHYLEVLKGVTVIDEYMYFQYNEIRVRV